MIILKILSVIFFLYYASNIGIRHKQINNRFINALMDMKESILETESTYVKTQEKFIAIRNINNTYAYSWHYKNCLYDMHN
ncbi:hypothetical protein [Clostridium botulinum]|uniref:hypothetical protein n=1 Tax=Clostridium botulinum TaxID=1491 RepID=UPI000A9604FA|nr:hypothetical protein [Clostridium botulinum]